MMSNANTSTSIVPSEASEQRGIILADPNPNTAQPPLAPQIKNSLDGPVAILWDIENCPVPSDVRPDDVAGNIRMALRVHPVIKGAVIMFSAYGDFNAFPRRLREGCQRTGVKLIDVPNGRKDAADKAILVDMFLFALDNPPPSSIMLISGDVDFSPALHILGQRGYTVILVIPSGAVSSALCNAGKFVWDWPSVARGEGFVPPMKTLIPQNAGPTEISGYLESQPEEEAIVYRGLSESYYNARDFSLVEYNSSSYYPSSFRSLSLPSGVNEVGSGSGFYDEQYHNTMWVQPGDINGLKLQLVKMLELSGGCLPFTRVPAEYQKLYGRPLYVSEYGALKLVNLFRKMSDVLAIDGRGQKKFVYIRNYKASPSAPPIILSRRDKKGKGINDEGFDNAPGGGSSDEVSDEEQEDKSGQFKREFDQNVEQFRYELQEILVSYSCRIFLGCFEEIYKQRYKKELDCRSFGVDKLEELFDKVNDVVVLLEEPGSKRKFLAAVGG